MRAPASLLRKSSLLGMLDGGGRDRWRLLRGRGEIKELGLLLIALIAQATPRHHDDEQCCYNSNDYWHHLHKEARSKGREKRRERVRCRIERSVQQHHQQQAATDIVEDPGEYNCECCCLDHERQEGNQYPNEAGPSSIVSWDQDEEGQVP